MAVENVPFALVKVPVPGSNVQDQINQLIEQINTTFGAIVPSNVRITGGTINGTTIGLTTPAAGSFTTLTGLTGSINGDTIATLTASQTLTNKALTSPGITGGTLTGGVINNTTIGLTTAVAGAFTSLSATSFSGAAIGTNLQAWDADLDALAALSSVGIPARTGAGTWALRTLTGTVAEITVTDGFGLTQNPTFSLPTALTFTGKTVTGGTFTGGAVTSAAITNSTIDNASIGLVTPAAGIFTSLTASGAVSLSTLANSFGVTTTSGAITIQSLTSGVITIASAATGAMNNVAIGGSTRSTGAFTTLDANGIFTTSSGWVTGVTLKTSAGSYTMLSTDRVIIVNKGSGAATTVNLIASPTTGTYVTVKDGKGDAATNNITITPAAGNIDGAGTKVINTNYGSFDLVYNGTQWNLV